MLSRKAFASRGGFDQFLERGAVGAVAVEQCWVRDGLAVVVTNSAERRFWLRLRVVVCWFAVHSDLGCEIALCSNGSNVGPSLKDVSLANLFRTALSRFPLCGGWAWRSLLLSSALCWDVLWVLGWVAAKVMTEGVVYSNSVCAKARDVICPRSVIGL